MCVCFCDLIKFKIDGCIIFRWWKDLDFVTNLPFARDRLVECYAWILGVYFEPQYSLARRLLTKAIVMTSVIDDTYDAYGIFEELELFHEAVERLSTKSTLVHLLDLI